MTESEWLNEASHSQGMVAWLGARGSARSRAGRRRLRLFACGCCRAAWDRLPEDRTREAIRIAERFADGLETKEGLAGVRAAIAPLAADSGPYGASPLETRVAVDMAIAATDPRAYSAAVAMTTTTAPLAGIQPRAAAEAGICRLLRCVFGNPFRPVRVPARALAQAAALARSIRDDRAFDLLPALADALESAGCDDAQVLAHCRGPDPHAIGCWVVDLVLGST
jgi:hypothetical protein